MNEQQLLVFMTVAEKSSFSESAKRLHMAQPTVTAQIKSLENELDAQLFYRTTKHVELTEAGHILYRYGKDILHAIDQAKKDIDSLKETVSGSLEIAASLTIGEYVLPKILGNIKKKYPHITLAMHIMNTEQIVTHIRDRRADVGLVEGLVDGADLHLQPFQMDELVLIAAPEFDHPALNKDRERADCDVLLDTPLIMREKGSGTRQVLEKRLTQKGIDPSALHLYLELGSTEAVKGAVAENLGISVISSSAIEKERALEQLCAYSLNGLDLKRYYYTVTLKDRVLPRPADAFIQEIVL